MVDAEPQHAPELGRRLSELAAQLLELANAVTVLEQAQRERDQTVQRVFAQIEALSSSLRTVLPPAAGQQAAPTETLAVAFPPEASEPSPPPHDQAPGEPPRDEEGEQRP